MLGNSGVFAESQNNSNELNFKYLCVAQHTSYLIHQSRNSTYTFWICTKKKKIIIIGLADPTSVLNEKPAEKAL